MKTQLINMEHFEKLVFKSLDEKRAFMDKMLADEINELKLMFEELKAFVMGKAKS